MQKQQGDARRAGISLFRSVLPLEKVLQRELGDATISSRQELAKGAITDRIVRVIEVRVIEEVEQLSTELDVAVLVNAELLEQ